MFDIRAGDVDFQSGNLAGIAGKQLAGQFAIFFNGVGRDIDDHRHAVLPELWQIFAEKPVGAFVLQTDGIENASTRFDDARFGIALPGRERDAFGDECAERAGDGRVVLQAGQFVGAAGGAGRGQQRAAQPQLAKLGFELVFHTMSFASNTGPSLQTRT